MISHARDDQGQRHTATTVSDELLRVCDFFSEIGLGWRWQPGARGFVDGVAIAKGELLVDPGASVSSTLHEAGHLACLPGEFRCHASGNLCATVRLMLQSTDFSDPDAPPARAALQCSDPEATAWAWAAGMHLGIAPSHVIQDHEYGKAGAEVRLQLQLRQYAGIHGLAAAGFCAVRPGPYATSRGLPAYPRLSRWLQLDFREVGPSMGGMQAHLASPV